MRRIANAVLLARVGLLATVGPLALAGCGGTDFAPLDASSDALVLARDAQPRADAGPPPADLEGFVRWQMDAGGILGLAAAITTPDRTVLTLTLGEASEGVPVDAHTQFILASISKTFAATAILQAVEDGQLDLDAPLEDVLGYPARNPAFPDVPVTTRMLLTHTAGLHDDLVYLGMAGTTGTDPTTTLDAFAREYLADPAHWYAEPGTSYEYSNAGFGIVGAVCEAATARDFRAFTEERIFAPLALDGAAWFIEDLDLSRVATPQAWNARTGFTPLEQQGFAYYPAGTLRVSIDGMARYARAVARGLELDGVRVLSDASFTELVRVPFPSVASWQAHGWEHEGFHGRTWLHHSGSTNGGSTQIYVGEDGVSIIVLTNSDAYIRNLLGFTEGAAAIRAILERLDDEATAMAR